MVSSHNLRGTALLFFLIAATGLQRDTCSTTGTSTSSSGSVGFASMIAMAEASPVDTEFVADTVEDAEDIAGDAVVVTEERTEKVAIHHHVLNDDDVAAAAAATAATSNTATASSHEANIVSDNNHAPPTSDPPAKHQHSQADGDKKFSNDNAPVDGVSSGGAGASGNNSRSKKVGSSAIPFVHPPKEGGDVAATVGTGTTAKKKIGGFTTPVQPGAKQARAAGGINFTSPTDDEEQHKQQNLPPDGFVLAARIISVDGRSYFMESSDDDVDSNGDDGIVEDKVEGTGSSSSLADLTIPFLDCGAVGSFTDAIGMKECSYRHLPAGAEPIGWTTVESPQLVVALHPLEVTVSGGGGEDGTAEMKRNFKAGDVLLFEDTNGQGHKMKSAPLQSTPTTEGVASSTLHPDMTVLIIALPRHRHYHSYRSSKEKGIIHLPALFGRRNRDTESSGSDTGGKPPRPCLVETDGTYSSLGPASNSIFDIIPPPGRLIRATLGAALSALLTHKLVGRTPIGVASCIGGCALVVGGTCGIAAVGEGTLDNVADWWEGFIVERRFAAREERLGDVEGLDAFEEDLLLFGVDQES